jgi:hypothetical protein
MFKNLIETYKINKNLLAKNPELSNILIGAIAVISVIIYFYYFKFSGNITGFFRIGSVLPLSPFLIPDQTLIFQDELGYDGQQFLSIALDPFLQDLDTLASLDHPAYRYRRILYPLLSYFLGFGNSQIIPYVMVAINAIAILLIIWVTGLYFKSYSAKVNQALFVLMIPGVWIVLSLSTSDLLASLFFVSAFYFYQNNKPIYMALMVSLGCLTRETLLLLWMALIVAAMWQKKYLYFKYLGMAIIAPLAWNIYVILLGLNGAPGTGNFGPLLYGIIEKFLFLFTQKFSPKTIFEAYLFILLILAFVLVFWLSSPRRSANRPLLVCSLIYLGMFSMSSLLILNYYLDYSRVFMDVYLLALLSIDFRSFPRKTIFFSASSLASIAFLVLHS